MANVTTIRHSLESIFKCGYKSSAIGVALMSLIARKWVPVLIKIQMCFMIYYAKALREIAREVRLTDCHHHHWDGFKR